MGLYRFDNLGIEALCAVLPKKKVKTSGLTDYYSEESIRKFIETTGVEERRFAEKNVCASDLCYMGACRIFEETDIRKEDIDMLIFVSQTPDYKIPATSILLQHRLGLKKDTLVYDVNMSCSGFIHGLLMAYNFLRTPGINHVMLMVGDTLSKITSLQDKGTGMLLGDAGIAAVIGKGEKFGQSFFSMTTEGEHLHSVYLPAGGSREPSSAESMIISIREDGSLRSNEQIVMVGSDVFSFAINRLPKDIKRLLEFSNKTIEEVDKFAFHQANNFMMDYIVKKCKADKGKVLHSIKKYGNTAGTSIPLCMLENREKIKTGDTILMNAIGAGFTYGTVLLNIADCKMLDIRDYEERVDANIKCGAVATPISHCKIEFV